MLIDSTRKAPAAAALTDAEAVSLMKSHVAYTAKYAVDPAQTMAARDLSSPRCGREGRHDIAKAKAALLRRRA
jgi:hypothetical protein